MFAKISRGDRVQGLLAYLVGPGRSNEHTEPHLVAGDPAMLAWHDDNELDASSAQSIARHLDRPRQVFDVAVSGGHVWHCSLSLRAEEGQLTDDRWRAITEAFVERMGFGDADGAKAATRWGAVRHGLSSNGNDHVHLVVNLVREDGTKASVHNDRIRARDLCRELEGEFGLEPLESANLERADVAFVYGEREAAARRRARARFEQGARAGVESGTWAGLSPARRAELIAGEARADQPRWELGRKVRACASASVDEAEFVRRLRQHGVLVRPRFADGRSDVVTGYSVAVRPIAGERPIWYGGGQLGKDLTLPRLRAEWPDTPVGAQAAVGEWTAAKRGRRPLAPGREVAVPGPEVWAQVSEELTQLRERLRTVGVEDREVWARVARHGAGALAAWSTRVEPEPGPLAAAADALARSAQRTKAPSPPPVRMPSATGAAYLLLAATKPGAAGQIAMLTALANLAKALHDMHRAEGAARRAAAIEAAVRGDLRAVSQRLSGEHQAETARAVAAADPQAVEAVRAAQRGQEPAAGSPIPARLEPEEGRAGAPGGRVRPGRGPGVER